jgi:hypothetical protein
VGYFSEGASLQGRPYSPTFILLIAKMELSGDLMQRFIKMVVSG